MIDITTGIHLNCDRISRRDCLRVGALAALGLSLGDLLAMEEARAATGSTPSADAVILLWLGGGMSQIDTFDPKPDAPSEIRGHFGTIPTKLAGIRFSDRMPRLADTLDKFCVLRAMTHGDRNHGSADHLMLTGYLQTPTIAYPSFGSVVARELGYRKSLPPFVSLPRPPLGVSYLGAQYNAFTVGGDPNAPEFTVRDVRPPAEVSTARLQRREKLLD